MLTTKNTNWNSKGIRSTNSHINKIFLVEKQNPLNESKSSCASFIINGSLPYSLPRFQEKNKMVVGLDQFPMTLTDMIVHGHGDKALAQYSNKLWTNDPSSLLDCYYIC